VPKGKQAAWGKKKVMTLNKRKNFVEGTEYFLEKPNSPPGN